MKKARHTDESHAELVSASPSNKEIAGQARNDDPLHN